MCQSTQKKYTCHCGKVVRIDDIKYRKCERKTKTAQCLQAFSSSRPCVIVWETIQKSCPDCQRTLSKYFQSRMYHKNLALIKKFNVIGRQSSQFWTNEHIFGRSVSMTEKRESGKESIVIQRYGARARLYCWPMSTEGLHADVCSLSMLYLM